MLNHDSRALFDAMSGISDEYLLSAADLLGETKESTEMHQEKLNTRNSTRKLRRTLLIAAVIVCLFTATAFAAGLFSVSTRVPDPEESFQIHWSENESGVIEWSDAKLVLTFPEVTESREIQFRPTWLPFELPSELPFSQPWEHLDKDTWFDRFASESLARWSPAGYHPWEGDIMQPLLIEVYSMSMFSNGGAILMLYQTPENLTEEHWDILGGVDVLKFHGRQHFDARSDPELGINEPAYDLEYDYVLLSNEEEGWLIRVCGQTGMETMEKVARGLEIRETGKTLKPSDFENRFVFIDGGVG